MITPPFTPAMQAAWDRAMLLARTRGAYGCAFPVPGTSYPPPTPGTMFHDVLFAITATDEEYYAHLAEVREDMVAWKARVRDRAPKRERPVDISGINLAELDFSL